MNRMKSIYGMGFLVVLVSFLSAQTAYDAIHIMEREIGVGTRALAMGGAYTALADDYTAAYWNPAGLGIIQQPELIAELSHMTFDNNAIFANQLTMNDQMYTRLRSFGLVKPLPTSQGSFVLAVGYQRIVDFEDNLVFSGPGTVSNGLGFTITDDNDVTDYYLFDSDANRYESVSSEGGLHQWTVSGAVALSPRFMLGITAGLTGGKEQYRFRFSQTDSDNNYTQFPADFDQYSVDQYLHSDYSALSLKIGALMKLFWGFKVGGVMTLPSRVLVEEVHSTSDELTFDDGYVDKTEDTGRFDYRVTTPFYFDGGLSYSSRFLTLSASVRYRDWSQTRFQVSSRNLDEADYREFLQENNQIQLKYIPTTEYHLGGEINLEPIHTKLRGGYALYPSPLADASGKEDRHYFTSGISFGIDKYVRLDIAYLYGTWERDSKDSYTPSGTVEDITDKKLLVGFTYTF